MSSSEGVLLNTVSEHHHSSVCGCISFWILFMCICVLCVCLCVSVRMLLYSAEFVYLGGSIGSAVVDVDA